MYLTLTVALIIFYTFLCKLIIIVVILIFISQLVRACELSDSWELMRIEFWRFTFFLGAYSVGSLVVSIRS